MNKFAFLMILIWAMVIITGSCIFWGLGNLVIWVFNINYTWTFWHGVVCQFIFIILKQIFGGSKGE